MTTTAGDRDDFACAKDTLDYFGGDAAELTPAYLDETFGPATEKVVVRQGAAELALRKDEFDAVWADAYGSAYPDKVIDRPFADSGLAHLQATALKLGLGDFAAKLKGFRSGLKGQTVVLVDGHGKPYVPPAVSRWDTATRKFARTTAATLPDPATTTDVERFFGVGEGD